MRIGVDLGGSKIEAIALDDDGRQLWRQRVVTPAGDYGAIVAAIADLVARLEHELGSSGSVGIGTPGSLSAVTGLMKNCNSTVLNGQPLPEHLSVALGREVRVANDANCFALSEACDGAASGAETVFGVILGTGVGGGLVVSQQVLSGANGIGGEWGHNPLPCCRPEGYGHRECYCGRLDCIETWLSGPGFERSYRQSLRLCANDSVSAGDIVKLAAAGDSKARACYDQYVAMLSRSLATVINIVDPCVIVLGGGMSNSEALYDDVMQQWGKYVFSDRVDTRLVKAQYGDSSGVRGAAWLWPVK